MKNEKIHFGTDGWRGVIANDFTFANVRRVAKAIGVYLTGKTKLPRVTIGYDTRFASRQFARTVADVLSQEGCTVLLSDKFCSTPCVSSSVCDEKAAAGIMISASHNPPEFNGIKIKTAQGGSAPETLTREIEALLDKQGARRQKGSVLEKDFTAGYWKRLRKMVDFDAMRKARLSVVVDPMYGAGIGYIESLLEGTGCRVTTIHGQPDPLFGGLHPEPIEQYLSDLKTAVKKNKAACGLATDGDADRVGVVDEKGRYLTPHQVFPLLLYYLAKHKGLKGKVVQAISLGYVSERIARDFGLECVEVPIGFKNVAEYITKERILAGGEESGGYGYGNYLPERDGILNTLVIIEMLATLKRPLSALLADIEKKYGSSYYLRTDFKNPGIHKEEFVKELRHRAPKSIGGVKVREIKDYDGIEFVLEDDSWLLLRPSGTEPIIRVYSESPSMARTKKIIEWGNRRIRDMQGR